jgi:hypothetical protein
MLTFSGEIGLLHLISLNLEAAGREVLGHFGQLLLGNLRNNAQRM